MASFWNNSQGGWSIDIDKWAKFQQQKIDAVNRKIALGIFRRVILRTPVDTGRARSNWFCTVGTPSTETTETDRAAVSEATQTVSRQWKPESGSAIFLTNNLPYIETLERGRVGNKGSMQAPQGMVKITLAEFGMVASEAWRWGNSWDVGGAFE